MNIKGKMESTSKKDEEFSDTMSNSSMNDETSVTSNEDFTEEELKKAEEYKDRGNKFFAGTLASNIFTILLSC